MAGCFRCRFFPFSTNERAMKRPTLALRDGDLVDRRVHRAQDRQQRSLQLYEQRRERGAAEQQQLSANHPPTKRKPDAEQRLNRDPHVVLAIAAQKEEPQRRGDALREHQRVAAQALEEKRQRVQRGRIDQRKEQPLLARRQRDAVAAGLFGAASRGDEGLQEAEQRGENGEKGKRDDGGRGGEEGAEEMEQRGETREGEGGSNAAVGGERAERKLRKRVQSGAERARDLGEGVVQRGQGEQEGLLPGVFGFVGLES